MEKSQDTPFAEEWKQRNAAAADRLERLPRVVCGPDETDQGLYWFDMLQDRSLLLSKISSFCFISGDADERHGECTSLSDLSSDLVRELKCSFDMAFRNQCATSAERLISDCAHVEPWAVLLVHGVAACRHYVDNTWSCSRQRSVAARDQAKCKPFDLLRSLLAFRRGNCIFRPKVVLERVKQEQVLKLLIGSVC